MNMRRFFSRRQRDEELVLEIEAHLEMEVEENAARGLSPEEARRQAHVKFGSPRRVRESEWEGNTLNFADDCWRDLKYAVRTLVRTPGFAISAVLVMALGIGANSALFTVVRSVLLKPLPFKDPGRLIQLYEVSPDGKRPTTMWPAACMRRGSSRRRALSRWRSTERTASASRGMEDRSRRGLATRSASGTCSRCLAWRRSWGDGLVSETTAGRRRGL